MFEKRFCAHRGLSALMPENTLPAFAAAVALGADEIELDVRLTKDKQLIVSHDPNLERVSDGSGRLGDYTLEELKQLNLGIHHGWVVHFCTLEEVFQQFANQVVLNIHLKDSPDDVHLVTQVKALAEKYNAIDSIYLAASPREFGILSVLNDIAPELSRDVIQYPGDGEKIYDMAVEHKCERVQFWLGEFDEALIQKLHDAGIRCNLFYADTPENYKKYFAMGVDTILTNRMDLAAEYRSTHIE